jgi:hypothetical protein
MFLIGAIKLLAEKKFKTCSIFTRLFRGGNINFIEKKGENIFYRKEISWKILASAYVIMSLTSRYECSLLSILSAKMNKENIDFFLYSFLR